MLNYEFINNLSAKEYRARGIYAEEHNLMRELLISDSEAIRFGYASTKKAVTAKAVLQTYAKKNRMSLCTTQKGSDVIVFKVKNEQK